MKDFLFLLITTFLCFVNQNNAKSISINHSDLPPHRNASFDFKVQNKGILLLTLSSLERNTLASLLSPTEKSILGFDSDEEVFCIWQHDALAVPLYK